jgi:hypothetical protein
MKRADVVCIGRREMTKSQVSIDELVNQSKNKAMNKLSALLFSCLIIFLVVFSLAPEPVLADGMAIKYSDRWDYSNETNQQAFINYEHGLQKMIISVGLDAENSDGVVWLFPIPADPSKVVIDVVKSVPHLHGEEISKKAKSNLDGIILLVTVYLQRR